MWILLDNIVHYYLYTATGAQPSTLTDRTDPNRCFRLGAEASSLNAFNYVYYAASKSPFSKIGDSRRRTGASLTGWGSSIGLYGHCNAFPTSRTSGGKLLEIDQSNNGSAVAISSVVTSNNTDLEIGAGNATFTP